MSLDEHRSEQQSQHFGYVPVMPSDRANTDTGAIGPKLLWNTVAGWWHIAGPVGAVLAVIAGLAVNTTYVPEFLGQAVIQIKSPEGIIVRDRVNEKQYIADQLHFLQSDLVLMPVLEKIDVSKVKELAEANDPLSELKTRVGVASLGRSTFYQVTFRSYSPHHAASIANAIVESYLQIRNDRENDKRQLELALYKRLRDEKNAEVAELRSRLINLERQYLELGTMLPPGTHAAAIPPAIHSLNSQIAQTKFELAEKEAKLEAVRRELATRQWKIDERRLAMAIDQHPEVAPLLLQLEATKQAVKGLEAQITEFRKAARNPEKLPEYQRLVDRLEQVKAEQENLTDRIEETRQSVHDEQLAYLREQETRVKEALLNQRQAEIRDLQLHLAQLEKAYQEEIRKAKDIGGDALSQRDLLLLDVAQAKQLASEFAKRIEEITLKGELESIKLVSPAEVPRKPISEVPWKKIFMAGGAAFLFPFGIALLWEFRIRRVSDSAVLEDSGRIPIVGEVASLPVRRVSRTRQRSGGVWMFEESIDALRTHLMVDDRLEEARAFAITSAVSQEGKTSVAAQLAVSIARSTGKRTVIIDGDMRSPDLHNIFDVEGNGIGLAEVLSDEVSVDDAVARTQTDNLDVLPAGQLRCNPHSLVGNGHFKGLLKALRARYDYVVLDTPPLLAASESLVMAKHCDVSLLCAMRHTSRLDQVRKAYERLQQANANPVGVVLNGIPIRHYASRYGDYAYMKRDD